MQSLQTTAKREAERLARAVSVRFDEICQSARLSNEIAEACSSTLAVSSGARENANSVLAKVPELIRRGGQMVVEEQLRNPRDWPEAIRRLKGFYEAMKVGEVPIDAYLPPAHAQAILNGMEHVLQGKPLPTPSPAEEAVTEGVKSIQTNEPWPALCDRALELYRHKVVPSRCQVAKRRLPDVRVQSTAVEDIQIGLLSWSRERLDEVKARTVKTQLDCMVAALRCVLPKLESPFLKELKGVMQPRGGDRQSMPVNAIKEAIAAFKARPKSNKVRRDYGDGGGAPQFDDIAIEALAVLGMRPRELIQADSRAIVIKRTTFNEEGMFFRITGAKNKASERDIPLSDGKREILDIARLRRMLEWQEQNPRAPHGAVTSLGTRFHKMTGGYTLYQMRHSWKDLAVNAGVDLELRERILGHAGGIAAVYGSGIPLRQGLDALASIRQELFSDIE